MRQRPPSIRTRIALLLGIVAVLLGCVPGGSPAPGAPTASVGASATSAGSTAPSAGPTSSDASAASTASPEPTAPATATSLPTPETVDPVSGLPWVDVVDLPPQAADTLSLIAAGGPFPFDRDGITFQNRERILPDAPAGTYREYTVITPGEEDRGARRIVTGPDGAAYYTGDHYETFVRIRLPGG